MPARTLEAVAEAAGVSRMTVSRVLRHPEQVAEATRQRVLECIEALSYRPNPLISTLMASTRQRKVGEANAAIAFVTSLSKKEAAKYEVVCRIRAGAEKRAVTKGYDVILHSLADEWVPEERFTTIMRARGIEGIIFSSLSAAHARLGIRLDAFACAACGFSLVEPVVHRVATNQMELASQAYLEAERRGYRRIGVVIHEGEQQGIRQQWISALLFHLRRSGNRIPMLNHIENDQAEFPAWLRRWRPDCVIGSLPQHCDWLREAGFSLPEKLGFLLLGNAAGGEAISGLQKNYEGIGAAAVDLIALQLHDNERGVPEFRKTILLDPQWNEGTTVRPAAPVRKKRGRA